MEEKSLTTRKTILIVFLAIICLVLAQITGELLSSIVLVLNIPEGISYAIKGIVYVVASYFLLKLLCRKLLHTSLDYCRITKPKVEGIWILTAVLLPLIVSIIMLLFPGELLHNDMSTRQTLNIVCMAIFYYGLGAGFVEEMVFRGVIMKVLEKRFGQKVAIIVPSVIFGLLHATGAMGILDIILLFIAGTTVGIMFSLIVYETGSIFWSAIVHGIWNVVIIGGILNIGAQYSSKAIFSYKLSNTSFFITGGKFGIESSLVSVIGYVLVSLLALLLIKRKKSR